MEKSAKITISSQRSGTERMLGKAQFMTVSDAANYLNVSEKTILRMIHRGMLPAFNPTSRILRIRASDVETMVAAYQIGRCN